MHDMLHYVNVLVIHCGTNDIKDLYEGFNFIKDIISENSYKILEQK